MRQSARICTPLPSPGDTATQHGPLLKSHPFTDAKPHLASPNRSTSTFFHAETICPYGIILSSHRDNFDKDDNTGDMTTDGTEWSPMMVFPNVKTIKIAVRAMEVPYKPRPIEIMGGYPPLHSDFLLEFYSPADDEVDPGIFRYICSPSNLCVTFPHLPDTFTTWRKRWTSHKECSLLEGGIRRMLLRMVNIFVPRPTFTVTTCKNDGSR